MTRPASRLLIIALTAPLMSAGHGLANQPSPPPPNPASYQGAWETPFNFDQAMQMGCQEHDIAHAILLPQDDGQVLFWCRVPDQNPPPPGCSDFL